MISTTIDTRSQLTFQVAQTLAELEAAFCLVHNAYVRAGLSEVNPCGMRVTPYHLLPSTEVFIAKCGPDVITTMSLIADGQLGLPMEAIYAEEIGYYRELGCSFAEISCLADRRAGLRRSFPVLFQLMRLVAQCAQRRGIDQLFIACHPRHSRLYQRLMAFSPVGMERAYPTVCSRPAVALMVDLKRRAIDQPKIHERFFGVPFSDMELEHRPISAQLLEHFRAMMDADPLLPIGWQVAETESVEPDPAVV